MPRRSLALCRSRQRRVAVVAGGGLAALGLLLAGLARLPSLCALALVAWTVYRELRASGPDGLAVDAGGQWILNFNDGGRQRGQLRSARIAHGVISLRFERPGPAPLALFADAFCDADHRFARLLLRHGNIGASC